MEQLSAKKWFLKCILILTTLLSATAIIMIVIDPYFHYHKPLPFLSYRLYEERYINDGISRHFEFDALITGTSMAQNFKPSQMDALFGTHSVKETFSGAGYQEIAENLSRTLQRNESLHTVLLALDSNGLLRAHDWQQYGDYPVYLYDENPLNDVAYLFNKSILYHGVLPCLALSVSGSPGTSMDEYSSWQRETGLDVILTSYDRNNVPKDESSEFGEKERSMVAKTITVNLVDIVNKYPDVTFYIFYPPYSICHWDASHIKGAINKEFDALKAAAELLLECPNVKLYDFFDQYDIICNPDNYSDIGHYSPEVNSLILQWIYEGTGLVTKENYADKLNQERSFYLNYDYDAIYADPFIK